MSVCTSRSFLYWQNSHTILNPYCSFGYADGDYRRWKTQINKNTSREGSCEKYSHVHLEQEWASARVVPSNALVISVQWRLSRDFYFSQVMGPCRSRYLICCCAIKTVSKMVISSLVLIVDPFAKSELYLKGIFSSWWCNLKQKWKFSSDCNYVTVYSGRKLWKLFHT